MKPDLLPDLSTLDPAQALPLRDILLPTRIGWWPPAPGWWLVAVITLATLALLVWLWRRHRGRQQLLKPATQSLQQIERRFARHGDNRQLVTELSTLLRQVALHRYPRREVAGLIGEPWLEWLDLAFQQRSKTATKAPFTQGVGRVLIEQTYQRDPEFAPQPLLALCAEWLTAIARAPLTLSRADVALPATEQIKPANQSNETTQADPC